MSSPVFVGLTVDIDGKSVGRIHLDDLKNRDERAIWATGWDVQIIKPEYAGFKLPLFVFEKRE